MKCIETLYDIEAIGKLKEIDTIFDLNEYENNKDELFAYLLSKRSLNLPPIIKNIPLIEAQGGKIPKILLDYQNGSQKTKINKIQKPAKYSKNILNKIFKIINLGKK